ncbi:unnamed protein product [Acanthoscelides obtectus]|uniref:Tc1-like transposase DDE domain-containing protein n=1 Tax=Acanthoscelides obtectus TaxID=200917 RepID=A0A9P0Q7Z8_ACAOB|nr:unnamed protein product [Acanthoscelides obtectus]CAK1676946.1 hypothetical protein AOBTE_LOCUS31014 [Acanthoscelides obtectus]
MESTNGTSGSTESQGTSRRLRKALKRDAKEIVLNVFNYLNRTMSQGDALARCESMTDIPEWTIRSVVHEKKKTGATTDPKFNLKGRKAVKLDDDSKMALRRTVHSFFFRNEIPTLKAVHAAIKENEIIPQMSVEVMRKSLHEINFRYETRNRKSVLIERPEIVAWHRKYLREINRQASIEGLSTGLRGPSGKGQRLIVTHIGSDSGFLEECDLIFVSKKGGDYHDEMNANCFESWFQGVLQRVEPNSVIVMDNASYHSRRAERVPTMGSRKSDMQQSLREKGIPFDDSCVKAELYETIKQHKPANISYVTDEMARQCGVTVLRLPPYHCELNPIELIWAQVKGYIARHNTTFKLPDVKVLLETSIQLVTPEAWQNAIRHVVKEETKMWQLDHHIDTIIEPVNFNEESDSDSLLLSGVSGSDDE